MKRKRSKGAILIATFFSLLLGSCSDSERMFEASISVEFEFENDQIVILQESDTIISLAEISTDPSMGLAAQSQYKFDKKNARIVVSVNSQKSAFELNNLDEKKYVRIQYLNGQILVEQQVDEPLFD